MRQVGRTGTFIAVARLVSALAPPPSLLSLVAAPPPPWQLVLAMRAARPKMVQHRDQYLFIFQCVRDFLKTRSK